MRTVGIDLGRSHSQICIATPTGRVVEERCLKTAGLVGYLSRRRKMRVIMESCSEAFRLYDQLSPRHEVKIVPSTLSRQLGVGHRGLKTDRHDARALCLSATRVRLPGIHVPSMKSRELKARLGMRQRTVRARTALINSVRGYLRTQLLHLRSGSTATFTDRVRELALPDFVDRQLRTIDQLSADIEAMNAELKELAKAPAIQRLMTVPGVGVITALSFISRIDDPRRFASAKHVQAYLGLTPGERSSGMKQRKTSITKAGNKDVRWLLIEAAWAASRSRGQHPMLLWHQHIEQKRGRRIARVALARKIAGILFAILRDQKPYQTNLELNG